MADLGLMSEVDLQGQASRCGADLLVDGILSRLPREPRRGRTPPSAGARGAPAIAGGARDARPVPPGVGRGRAGA